MKKILTYGSIGSLALLVATSVLKIGNGIDLFMTSSVVQDFARVALIVLLISTLFVGYRPRTRLFPGIFATVSAMVIVYTLSGLVEYGLQVFDTLAYLLAAVILMVEALSKESRIEPTRASQLAI